jgi:hypothetical protein
VPIHVNVITVINNITLLCVDKSDEKSWGDNSTEKEKRGELKS